MDYLKSDQYYIDLYDLSTINECLYYYKRLYNELPKAMALPNKENLSEEKRKNDWFRIINITLHAIKTERFKTKNSIIEKWMQRDQEKQEKYDNTEPGEYYCKDCSVLLESMHKNLNDDFNKPLRMLFLYECPRCKKKEGYYDDGEIYKSKPNICEKCGSEVKVSIKIDDNKDITTWIYRCKSCDFKKTDTEDHKKWQEEHEKQEEKDKELLEKFRKDFCFTEEEGNKAVSWFEGVKNLIVNMREREKKDKDPVFQKAKSLNKLIVVEVRKLLKETLEKEGYIDLQFEKPEMGRIVAVPFIVQDEKVGREKYDSKKQLKKFIDIALKDTNWRLMSDGLDYRVGYLNGKLRCYESDEEMTKFLKKDN